MNFNILRQSWLSFSLRRSRTLFPHPFPLPVNICPAVLRRSLMTFASIFDLTLKCCRKSDFNGPQQWGFPFGISHFPQYIVIVLSLTPLGETFHFLFCHLPKTPSTPKIFGNFRGKFLMYSQASSVFCGLFCCVFVFIPWTFGDFSWISLSYV